MQSARVLLAFCSLHLHADGARVTKRSARAGHCCFYNGCDGCDLDPNAYCNTNEGVCTGDCGGNWCGGTDPTSSPPPPTPTAAPTPPVPTPPPVSGSPVEQHGMLSVVGTKVVGEHGSPVQLRGMSMFWSQWSGKYWNADVVNWLVQDFKVNFVRAAMGADSGGYMTNPAEEKAKLVAVVDACISAGIYVMIDWHDHDATDPAHTEAAAAFFDEMATKYAAYPNVLYEIFNEPLDGENHNWDNALKPYHERIVPIIRAHTQNIITLGTRAWSQKVEEACRNRVSGTNLVYTLHFYAQIHKDSLRNGAQNALNMGCPLFISEWGTGFDFLDLGSSKQWLDWADANDISSANWGVYDKGGEENAALAFPASASAGSGGWAESELSESGRWVRAYLRAGGGGGVPTPGGGGGGCCRFEDDCGDCGEDGTGWCHLSSSNCDTCTGTFDPSGQAPRCDGSVNPVPTPTMAPSPPMPTSPPVSGSPVEQHGFLRVQGNKIVGEHGDPVRLRGMSLFWSQWMGQYWNADVINWLVDDWHITMIRLAMGVDQGGYLENPSLHAGMVQTVVDAAIARGIYAVIDWHDHHAEDHVQQAKGFFDQMAARYGQYPNVLYETYNEPTSQGWSSTIKPYHQQIIPVIRSHTDNLIILGTRTWSQEVDTAAADPVSGVNLAYTIHFYASTHGQSLRNRVSTALSRGVPIFATEWGTCEADGNGRLDFGSTNTWLGFFAQNHISDANWAIADKSEACAALQPGASPNGGWSEAQLTESGRWLRNSLRNGGGPSPPPAGGAGGCCKFEADCGDCGEDGTGWCHDSAENCDVCTGIFDSSAQKPSCGR